MRRALVVAVVALSTAGCAGRRPCGPAPQRVCGAWPAGGGVGARTSAAVPRAAPRPAASAVPAGALAEPARHGRGSAAVWSFLAAKYDRDRDGRVLAAEYPRDRATFSRLDRDGDGALEAADLAGPTRMDEYVAALVLERIAAQGPPAPDAPDVPDRAAVRRAFLAADADDDGFLERAELERALAIAEERPIPGVLDLPGGVAPFPFLAAAAGAEGSTRVTLAQALAWRDRAAARAEMASASRPSAAASAPPARPTGPEVGEDAPDFTLPTRDGSSTVTLSTLRAGRPVALVFGSHTCPPFRHAAPAIRRAHDRHRADAAFLFVYVREAHAIDGRAPMPAADQPIVEEPRTAREKADAALACARALGFDVFPTVVDGLDDAVNRAYAAAPVRLYVVGRDGKVAYRSGPGPFGLDPDAFEAAVRDAARR